MYFISDGHGLQSSGQNFLDIRMSPLHHPPKSPVSLTHSSSHHNLHSGGHQQSHSAQGCPSPDLLMLAASRSSLTGSPLHVNHSVHMNHSSLMGSISPSLSNTLHNSRLGSVSAANCLDSSVLTDPTTSALRLEDTVRNLTFQWVPNWNNYICNTLYSRFWRSENSPYWMRRKRFQMMSSAYLHCSRAPQNVLVLMIHLRKRSGRWVLHE